MQTIKGELPDFDELEELVAESTRTVTASTVEDLDDLDSLLEESTALASAKRAQKQGRKLTAEQMDILDSNHLTEQMQVWEPVEAVAHFIHTTCSCGHEFRRFNAWYKLLTHRRQESSRLVRCDDHEGLPSSQYTTKEVVGYCHECLSTAGLPLANVKDLSILTSLGESVEQDSGQLELELLSGEAAGDVMLAELEARLDAEIEAGEITMETFQACDNETLEEEEDEFV